MSERSQEFPKGAISPEEFRAALELFDRYSESAILIAAMARDMGAYSWRDFLVGSAVFTATTRDRKIKHSFGANIKLAPGPKTPKDKCAERNALESALNGNPDAILAIVTVSKETDTDNQEGSMAHDVLHPCKECRILFRELLGQGLLNPESRLICVKDNGKFWKKRQLEGSLSADKIKDFARHRQESGLLGLDDVTDFARNYTYEKKETTTIGELLSRHQSDIE